MFSLKKKNNRIKINDKKKFFFIKIIKFKLMFRKDFYEIFKNYLILLYDVNCIINIYIYKVCFCL